MLIQVAQIDVVGEHAIVPETQPEGAALDQVLAVCILAAEVVEAEAVVVHGGPSEQRLLDDDAQVLHFGKDLLTDALHDLAYDLSDHVPEEARLHLLLQLVLQLCSHGQSQDLAVVLVLLLRLAASFARLAVEAVKLCGTLHRLAAGTERVKVVIAHKLANGDHLVKVLGHILLPVDAVQAVGHELTDLALVLAERLQRVHLQLYLLPSRVQVLQVDLGHLVAAGGVRPGAQVRVRGEHLLLDRSCGDEVGIQVRSRLVTDEALVVQDSFTVVVVNGLKVLLRDLRIALRAIHREPVVRLLALCRGLVRESVNLLRLHDLQAIAVVLKDFKATVPILNVLADHEAVLLQCLPILGAH